MYQAEDITRDKIIEQCEEKRFAIVIETKNEGPLLWESQGHSYEEAKEIMTRKEKEEKVIRVGIVYLHLVDGNSNLVPLRK